jgi:FkbM family methyltransferase
MLRFLLRARKLLFAMSTGIGRRALFHGVGACIEHGPAFVGRSFATVVDIGANRGQFTLFSLSRFPNARIISFEPQPEANGRFRKVFEGVRNVTLHPLAVGPQSARMDLHVTARNDSSSFLSVGSRQREEFGTSEVGKITVDVRRLDEVLSEADLVAPALLKIDVQGFEASVLKGCGSLLSKFDTIYLEGSYVELYEGQPLIGELVAYLAEYGFAPNGEFNQAVDREGRPLQSDFRFEKDASGQRPQIAAGSQN